MGFCVKALLKLYNTDDSFFFNDKHSTSKMFALMLFDSDVCVYNKLYESLFNFTVNFVLHFIRSASRLSHYLMWVWKFKFDDNVYVLKTLSWNILFSVKILLIVITTDILLCRQINVGGLLVRLIDGLLTVILTCCGKVRSDVFKI